MKSSLCLFAFAVSLMSLLTGCGGKYPVRPTTGKVVANGQPVTSGSVTFVPIGTSGELEAGKPASGAIKPDGTFTLSTFNRFDGAIVGKHRVEYAGAEDDGSEDESGSSEETTKSGQTAKKQTPQFVQKGEIIVEVKASGPNDFTIDIQSGGK